MSKKIVIVCPHGEECEDAKEHVKELGYDIFEVSPDSDLGKLMAENQSEQCSPGPLIIGVTSIQMAIAGNVCFAGDWRKYDYCVDLFCVAFRYGLNIVTLS